MKEKPPSKARREEWEKFLKENRQLPIYMGDHMTRPWTKSEAGPNAVEDTKTNDSKATKSQNSLGKNCTAPDSHTPVLPLSRSQYSVRKISNGRRKLKSSKEILMRHNVTEEDMLAWQESFDALLSSPAGRYVFRLFLESEIADENLKFWLACEDLKNVKSKKKLVKHIQDIYNTYIDVYSPHEINIEYKMREEIVEKLGEKVDVSIFTKAQHQVYNLMHRDSYPRFLSSAFTADLMDALAKRRESDVKAMKTISEETSSRTSTGLISCCCCRPESDHDVIVEDQQTASTSAAFKSSDPPHDRDDPAIQFRRPSKTNSLVLHDLTSSDRENYPNSTNNPEVLRSVPKSISDKADLIEGTIEANQ